jgi:20S proteasome alpha/beta subunit
MTLILGSKCADGVVLIDDKKVILNGGIDIDYRDKLFAILDYVTFGSSGSTDNFELFRGYVMEYFRKHQISFDDIIKELSGLAFRINRKYNFDRAFYFDVLVALQFPDKPSTLTFISGYGNPRTIEKYHMLDSGASYAKVFLEKLWCKDLTMEQFAKLGYFIIKYVEDFNLNRAVGIGYTEPQIWFIPNNYSEKGRDYLLSDNKRFDIFRLNALKMLNKHQGQLNTLKRYV